MTANSADLRRFQTELREKLDQQVDMDTIIWIWDEYEHLTPGGKSYQRFRQQMLDEIDGKYPNHSWAGESQIP